jgi:hypothetical protein
MSQSKLTRLWSKIALPRVGIYCALVSAGCCGLGSLLGQFAPNFHHRHIAAYWWAPRWHAVWVFVLLVALAVWLAHASVRLGVAFLSRKRSESASRAVLWQSSAVAGFVGVLSAYTWFVIASPSEEFRVTTADSNIHGEFYRVVRVEGERRTEGARPMAAAWIERRVGSTPERMRVERGKWWPSRVGNYELALARTRLSPSGAVFRHGDQRVTLDINKPAQRGLLTFLLRALHRRPQDASSEVQRAEVEIGGKSKVITLDPEWAGENAFLGMKESPVIVLRVHRTLTVPLATLASALLGLGYALYRIEKRLESRSPQ